MFEDNEQAIDVAALQAKNEDRFEFLTTRYGGGVAYLLVLNSLVFRIPLGWKRHYSRLCMGLEALIGKVGEIDCAIANRKSTTAILVDTRLRDFESVFYGSNGREEFVLNVDQVQRFRCHILIHRRDGSYWISHHSHPV